MQNNIPDMGGRDGAKKGSYTKEKWNGKYKLDT